MGGINVALRECVTSPKLSFIFFKNFIFLLLLYIAIVIFKRASPLCLMIVLLFFDCVGRGGDTKIFMKKALTSLILNVR